MGPRFWRIVKLLLVAAVPAAFLLLSVRGFVVRNAVVTAEIIFVRTPIDGEIVESRLYDGMPVGAEGAAVTLRNPRSDPRDMDSLSAEIAEVLRAIEIRHEALDWHEDVIADIEKRLQAAFSGLKLDLQLELEIVQSDMSALRARIDFLLAQYDRAQRLQGSAASQANLDAAKADLDEARAQLRSLQLTTEQIEQRLAFLDRGLPIVPIPDHPIVMQDRLAEMRNRRQAIAMELADLENRLDSLKARFDSEQALHEVTSASLHAAPPAAVIWEVFRGTGAAVTAGTPLFSFVDCEQRMVQVAVGDSTVELIRAGHPVEIRLYGGDEPLQGKVKAIFGSAARVTLRTTLAAHVPDIGYDDAVVLIAIPPADEEAHRHRLCDVGRTAYVEFEGIGFLDPLINRLF